MSIIGNGIFVGINGSGLPYETGTVTTSGRNITITHNLNTDKVMCFYELNDMSAIPNSTVIGGVFGAKLFGDGATAGGTSVGIDYLTGLYRSSSSGNITTGGVVDGFGESTSSSLTIDTGINTTATRTYRYVIVAMP